MTTQEIQKAIGKMQVLKFHSPVIENFTPFWRWEYDVLSISKSQMLCEFEVKISRSDFNKQKEKTKMDAYSREIISGKSFGWHGGIAQVPNYFSYCCPTGLIKESEIPKFAGLYYCENGEITEIQTPKRLHSHKFNLDRVKEKMLRYFSERTLLGGCRMTYENKESSRRWQEYNKIEPALNVE